MKEAYEALTMEVIAFETEDVIGISGGDQDYIGGDAEAAGGGYWFGG